MAVIPIRAALLHRKAIDKGLAGRDAGEADAGNAIHLERHQNAVPMDGTGHAQAVGDAQRDRGALAPTQDRTGQHPVNRGRHARGAGVVDRGFSNIERELGAGQHRGLTCALQCPRWLVPRAECNGRAAQRQSLHEAAARKLRRLRRGNRVTIFHGELPRARRSAPIRSGIRSSRQQRMLPCRTNAEAARGAAIGNQTMGGRNGGAKCAAAGAWVSGRGNAACAASNTGVA